MQFTFTVPGKPVPKARPRLGRGRRVFTPQKTIDYEQLVFRSASKAIPADWPQDTDYELDVTLVFDSNVYGDCDNVAKSISDGLNHASVWPDDKRVSRLLVQREFGPQPHVLVVVRSVPRKTCTKKSTRAK